MIYKVTNFSLMIPDCCILSKFVNKTKSNIDLKNKFHEILSMMMVYFLLALERIYSVQRTSTVIVIIDISDHLICLLIWILFLNLFSYFTYLLGPPFSRLYLNKMLLRSFSQHHCHALAPLSLILIEIRGKFQFLWYKKHCFSL